MEKNDKLYQIAVGGKDVGTYSREELRKLLQEGALDRSAMYLHEETKYWRPVSHMVSGLEGLPGALGIRYPRYTKDGSLITSSRAKRRTFVILGLLLGGFGAHNFYAHRHGWALAQVLATVSCLVLGLPIFIVWVWSTVEVIVVTKDGDGYFFS